MPRRKGKKIKRARWCKHSSTNKWINILNGNTIFNWIPHAAWISILFLITEFPFASEPNFFLFFGDFFSIFRFELHFFIREKRRVWHRRVRRRRTTRILGRRQSVSIMRMMTNININQNKSQKKNISHGNKIRFFLWSGLDRRKRIRKCNWN